MIHRNVTRVLDNTTEVTSTLQNLNSSTVDFVQTTGDFLYIGFQGKFSARYFDLGTVNSNSSTVAIEQWSGSDWVAVKDVVDQTSGFTQSGFISWVNNDQWQTKAQTPVTDREIYWVRLSVSADLSAGTTLQSLTNLYSDDSLLRIYYPEIVSDGRYLPSGRTDFLEQHRAAKDLCVLRLKQRRVIDDESQIIDINPIAVAAVHACALSILRPIEQDGEFIDRVEAAFNQEINRLDFGVDKDNSGIVSEAERKNVGYTDIIRRG